MASEGVPGRQPLPSHTILGPNGKCLNAEEFKEYTKRKGLCHICGEVYTHEVKGNLFSAKKYIPIEEFKDANGNLRVYKGYCLGPTCYTKHQVMEELGERSHRHRTSGNNVSATVQPNNASANLQPNNNNPNHTSIDDPMHDTSSEPSRPRQRNVKASSSSSIHQLDSGSISSRHMDETGSIASNQEIKSQNSETEFVFQPDNHSSQRPPSSSSIKEEEEIESTVSPIPIIPMEDLIVQKMKDAIDSGDFNYFMALLANHQSMQHVVAEAFKILCKAVHVEHERNPRLITIFVTDSWVKSITSVISDHADDEVIQELGVSSLAVLSKVSRRYMLDIARHGGVNLILTVLEKHMENAKTVDSCCCALLCLIDVKVKEGDDIPRDTGLLMSHENGAKVVKRLISVMGTASEEGKCWAFDSLTNLSLQGFLARDGKSLAHHIQNAAEGNGIDVLIDAINTNTANAKLAQSGMELLNRVLVEEDTSNTSSFVVSDRLLWTIKSVISHVTLESIHVPALTLLGNITVAPTTVPAGTLLSIGEEVSKSMKQFSANDLIQAAAMKSFTTLLSPLEDRTLLSNVDKIVAVIVKSMTDHLDILEVQTNGSIALATIASENESGKVSIVSNSGVHVLAEALNRHVLDKPTLKESSEVLRVYACTVFASLAASPLTRSALNDEAVMSAFMKATHGEEMTESMKTNAMAVLTAGIDMDPSQQKVSIEYALHLLRNASTREETETSVLTLSYLCNRSPSALETLIAMDNGRGIARITAVMAKFIESVSIQEGGCEIISEVFAKFPFTGRFGVTTNVFVGAINVSVVPHSEEDIVCIRKAIKLYHRKSPWLVVKAYVALMMFLRGLASVESRPGIADERLHNLFSGMLKQCTDVLSIHQGSTEITNSCMGLIQYLLLLDDKGELRLRSAFLIESILSGLELHISNKDTMLTACSTLSAIFSVEEDATALESMDGQVFARLMMICMKSDSEQIAEIASELIATSLGRVVKLIYIFVNPTESRVDTSDPEVFIEAIVGCMMKFSANQAIAGNCCSILASAAEFHEEFLRLIIIERGGLDAVLQVLKNHSTIFVQEKGARALQCILKSIPNDILSEIEAFLTETTMRMLVDYVDNASIESSILDTFWVLCSRGRFFKEFVSNQGAVPKIVEVMVRNIHDRSVQAEGCTCLWSLTTFGDNKRIIGECGGLKAIIDAMLAHLESGRLQKAALTALKNLATTPRNKQTIVANGGDNVIIMCMRVNMRSETVLSAAFSALNNIAVNIRPMVVADVPESTFGCILLSMRRYPLSEEVQENACILLKSYTFSSHNLAIMREKSEELMTALCCAKDIFPEKCEERANHVIGKLFE